MPIGSFPKQKPTANDHSQSFASVTVAVRIRQKLPVAYVCNEPAFVALNFKRQPIASPGASYYLAVYVA